MVPQKHDGRFQIGRLSSFPAPKYIFLSSLGPALEYQTIISVSELQNLLKSHTSKVVIFDCSFDLANPALGLTQFQESRIAGSLYASLDTDLSAHNPKDAVNGGRHPLPSREIFANWLSKMGVTHESQVIVYDRQGVNFCGRLWWMLKWCGHSSVAILDGGLKAWTQAGGETENGEQKQLIGNETKTFKLNTPLVQMLSIGDLKTELNGQSPPTLVDARGTPRFKGEVEPLDPIAGHIPGALNRPFNNNLNADGFFKSKEELRREFDALLSSRNPSHVVHQCGSGVSAVPNLVAMVIAGFGYTTLYPGSWSEWSREPNPPVER